MSIAAGVVRLPGVWPCEGTGRCLTILVGIVLAACARGAATASDAGARRPHRPNLPSAASTTGRQLALVGTISPWEKSPGWLALGGGWSATRGWVRDPGDPEHPFPPAWSATSWQLFTDPEAKPQTIGTKAFPEWWETGSSYALTTRARAGVAVAGVARPRPRPARRVPLDSPELRSATRTLLSRYSIAAPRRPRILQAYRVDLDGDGREELLWTARSREGWRSPYRDQPDGPRWGDYALLGLRSVMGHGVREVALSLARAGDDCSRYRLFCPLDINSDGRMEILAHEQGFEEDRLLAFTFDGRDAAGILGTHLPNRKPGVR